MVTRIRTQDVARAPVDRTCGPSDRLWRPRKPIRLAKSAYLAGDPFLLTVCTANKSPLFSRREYAATAMAAMQTALQKTKATLFCAVLMPDHAHLILAGAPGKNPLDTAYCWKRLTTARLRRQDLGGPVWQPRVHDRGLNMDFSSRSLVHAVYYVLDNPVRRALVPSWQAWPYRLVGEGVLESL